MCVHLFVEVMGFSVEVLYLFYTVVGAIIMIAMTTLAGAALRSTKSQVKRHQKKTFTHITDRAENIMDVIVTLLL